MTPLSAMVLAAGRGERMRPLSDVVPKPALPLPDGPLVRSALRCVARVGAGRVVVNTWHLAERMEAAARSVDPGPAELLVSREEELMGGAGGLALARDRGLLGDAGPVLVVNGDCRFDLDLEPLLARHARAGDLVTLAVLPNPDPGVWSRVLLDDRGRVARILRAGPTGPDEQPFLFTGAMLVAREALDRLPLAVAQTSGRLWGAAIEQGRMGGAQVSGSWCEVGDPTSYLSLVARLLAGESRVDPTATVAADARLEATFVGPDGRVGARAEAARSVVAAGGEVGPGERVDRVVRLGLDRCCWWGPDS